MPDKSTMVFARLSSGVSRPAEPRSPSGRNSGICFFSIGQSATYQEFSLSQIEARRTVSTNPGQMTRRIS